MIKIINFTTSNSRKSEFSDCVQQRGRKYFQNKLNDTDGKNNQ